MFRELTSRFTYVDMIKRMTLVEGTEELPYPTPSALAAAFNLYPHRREVPFILARMGRLLSFDDQTSNYNKFVAEFWNGIDVNRIIAKYKCRKTLERYKGAIDPIIFFSRLTIEAKFEGKENLDSIEKALALLNTYRRDDALAEIYRMVYEHEIIEGKGEAKCSDYLQLKKGIEQLLDEIRDEKSPKKHICLATSHVFQELLDHYALLHIDLATIKIKQGVSQKSITECKEAAEPREILQKVPELYMRILTMRRKIANASDVPWFEGPGKLSIYHYFKHQVGRETVITNHIMTLFDRLPGLQESMKKRVFEAEAFKEFRNLETWDIGTPLSASFAGTNMHKKMVEWLKSGW